MGNGLAKLSPCIPVADDGRRRHVSVASEPFPDDGLGGSFFSISGAAISANPSTPLSTSAELLNELTCSSAASFESSRSFASVPLQPLPRFSASLSWPLSGPVSDHLPERAVVSGPLEPRPALFSGPLDRPSPSHSSSSSVSSRLHRSVSQIIAERRAVRSRRSAANLSFLRGLTRAVARAVAPASKLRRSHDPHPHPMKPKPHGAEEPCFAEARGASVQWAQGKAGEDRVHVVVSEEHGWVFVGIYDGFNGPDATDYLLSNLYSAVHGELRGLLWEQHQRDGHDGDDGDDHLHLHCCDEERQSLGACLKSAWGEERSDLDRKLQAQLRKSNSGLSVQHRKVLRAVSQALRKTEEAYLNAADKMLAKNPELALMGSCLLVLLMKGEDVYIMNVGDSRAVLAQKSEPDLTGILGKATQDLERFKLEMLRELEAYEMDELSGLTAMQLTLDHSTSVDDEVRRIRHEHPEDPSSVVNGRVKGSLKVTRAFGAGYLKQPKWNKALLERFRVDYVGTAPYITCNPFLRYHRLTPKDRFLILSSDGLYQYFTNEEVVAQVGMFAANNPEGDPAQYLVEQVLLQAASKAGMDFHELIEIPQGERRLYHDDVSIIIISLEGRIWRSSV
ncbi:probable protein phosphatase 2C 4 [Ananas comosus]|uniref:protein-serine/threonine phosphatase n=1 Tax=Ananas comosus TaxID=4615 RepID=A0A6P5GJP7_ANACO|nr:probable protein phosphatase 2C 4 [Ananas comosus]